MAGMATSRERAGVARTAWLVRAGRDGENEDLALGEGVAVIGWAELPDLEQTKSAEEIRSVFEQVYPDETRSASIGSQVGQIFRFVRDLGEGDVVVLPLKTNRGHVAIGRVVGPYEYRPEPQFASDARHTRRVDWLAREIPYSRFGRDLQQAFGLRGTVREIHVDNGAQQLLSAAAEEDGTHRRAWIFQANPRIYEIDRAIRTLPSIEWTVRQYRRQVHAGDRVYVWRSGESAGIVAVGSVLTSPSESAPDAVEEPFYLNREAFSEVESRVRIGIEQVVDPPLLATALSSDSNLANLQILKFRNATVFRVTAEEDAYLQELLRLAPLKRYWWVNQGASYHRAREGGYLWAPIEDKNGGTPEHWRAMRDLREGDVVLNYANTQLRACSGVLSQAAPASRPDPDADKAWGEDGLKVVVDYRELSPTIALGDIPTEWRIGQSPFTKDGGVKQGYLFPLSDEFVRRLARRFKQLGIDAGAAVDGSPAYLEPPFEVIVAAIEHTGLTIALETIRRYHISLKTRGFAVVCGISGTGKTWLAEAYAAAVGARHLIVPVAPNWTTNEDLLGYLNPLDNHYHDTEFSLFLRAAADEYYRARRSAEDPLPFHLILDEMNLARVEYYFAKFLSAMELRARSDDATIELAPGQVVHLPPNLKFIGTVNVDETTHGFADKVYDRSQLVELTIDQEAVLTHLGQKPYAPILGDVWVILCDVAPFAFRVLDEIAAYVDAAATLDVRWEEALDEQLLQKVLPKIRGTDLRLGPALRSFIELAADRFPLSHAKATSMLKRFSEHGFTSYF